MGSDVVNIKGFLGRGGEVSRYNPHEVFIVGHDVEPDEDLWPFVCARLEEEIAEVEAEVAGTHKPGPDDLSIPSIREHGIIQPGIGVRIKGRIFVVDCRRRTLRARIVWDQEKALRIPEAERKGALPMRLVPMAGEVGARNGKTPAQIWALNVEANKHKAMTALQRAHGVLHFMDHLPPREHEDELPLFMKIIAAAQQFRVTETTIRNDMKLLNLTPKWHKAIAKGDVTMTHALKVADQPKAEQDKQLAGLLASGATKGQAMKNGVAAGKGGGEAAGEKVVRMLSREAIESWTRNIRATHVISSETECALAVLDYIRTRDPSALVKGEFKILFNAAGKKGKG